MTAMKSCIHIFEDSIRNSLNGARYMTQGNSVAIPCVEDVLRGIAYFLHKSKRELEESVCISTPIT